MADPLGVLWACFDSVNPLFSWLEVVAWDPAVRTWLIEQGVLKRAPSARMVACPSCPDGHIEEVLAVPESDPPRYFVPCPQTMRVEITPTMLEQWSIDGDAVAALISEALRLKGHINSVVSGRMWRLGTTPVKGRRREVVLARGLQSDDHGAITAHLGPQGRQIVLVAQTEPPIYIWPGRPPACGVLAGLVSFGEGGLQVDVELLFDIVHRADEIQENLSALPLDPEGKKLLVRRQVKAEVESYREDDMLVAAYRQHGSLREAARALTELLGRKISKDKVRRAVQRAGGIDAISRDQDSPSVKRRVASQRRDKGMGFLQRR